LKLIKSTEVKFIVFFNDTALYLNIRSFTIFEWFTLFGSMTAYILFLLKLKDYYQDRIRLKIDIISAQFSSEPLDSDHNGGTKIEILADIKNKGKQPTTISKVNFFSDNPDFSDFDLHNYNNYSRSDGPSSYFKPIRVNANDRTNQVFVLKKGNSFEGWDELNCTIIFETSHNTIVRNVRANRVNDINIYEHLTLDRK